MFAKGHAESVVGLFWWKFSTWQIRLCTLHQYDLSMIYLFSVTSCIHMYCLILFGYVWAVIIGVVYLIQFKDDFWWQWPRCRCSQLVESQILCTTAAILQGRGDGGWFDDVLGYHMLWEMLSYVITMCYHMSSYVIISVLICYHILLYFVTSCRSHV